MTTSAVLVGCAIGDAAGMPFEQPKDEIHSALQSWDGEYQEGRWHKLPAGHWTDDTEMSIALTESLIETNGVYDPALTARKYLAWADATPHGMGGTTKKAMNALREGKSWDECGVVLSKSDEVGSGTVMRVASLGVLFEILDSPYWITRIAQQDAFITHRCLEAFVANCAVISAISLMLKAPLESAALLDHICPRTGNLATELNYSLDEIQTTSVYKHLVLARSLAHTGKSVQAAIAAIGNRGNVAQITASALYCAAVSTSFEQGVIEAVKAGGDADTRGAVAGGILGAIYGLEGIPAYYKENLHQFEYLAELDRKLLALHPSYKDQERRNP